jgi:hypothetical protein
MKLPVLVVLAAAAAGSLFAASALSQEGGEAAPAAPAAEETEKKAPKFRGADPRDYSKAEMEACWMAAMTPNQFHARLGKQVGEWECESKMWMEPGAEPMASKGSAKISWLFPGGKWLKQEYAGNMMGMPFQGLLIQGYDNSKKKYVATWVDSMGTSLSSMEGNYDMEGKTLTLWGTMTECATGEHDRVVKYAATEVSDDHVHFEIWDMGFGTGFKVMEMDYRRKK